MRFSDQSEAREKMKTVEKILTNEDDGQPKGFELDGEYPDKIWVIEDDTEGVSFSFDRKEFKLIIEEMFVRGWLDE
jgi:hypothetical protein